VIVDHSLNEKVAIVTGACKGGIGEAYAKALAEAGASVTCADINVEGANDVADAINGAGGTATAIGVDITDDAGVEAMVRQTTEQFGGVDILVNNAALMIDIAMGGATLDFPEDLWDKAFDVNVKGAWRCTKAAVPSMIERGGGAIVNQASIGAYPATGVYGITKIAMVGMTTTFATELGPHNIRVNCIAPGLTQSLAGAALTPDDADYTKMMASRAPLKLKGDPSELCGALLLFCSPAGSWITGQVMVVDGGVVMRA
jgi:NAD(P)-dependent dehydrogenase (short-subunit alcohol dehydrogenase family)